MPIRVFISQEVSHVTAATRYAFSQRSNDIMHKIDSHLHNCFPRLVHSDPRYDVFALGEIIPGLFMQRRDYYVFRLHVDLEIVLCDETTLVCHVTMYYGGTVDPWFPFDMHEFIACLDALRDLLGVCYMTIHAGDNNLSVQMDPISQVVISRLVRQCIMAELLFHPNTARHWMIVECSDVRIYKQLSYDAWSYAELYHLYTRLNTMCRDINPHISRLAVGTLPNPNRSKWIDCCKWFGVVIRTRVQQLVRTYWCLRCMVLDRLNEHALFVILHMLSGLDESWLRRFLCTKSNHHRRTPRGWTIDSFRATLLESR